MLALDLSSPAATAKSLKDASRKFLQLGAPLAATPELSKTARRSNGISFREAHLIFKDGQTVKLLVKLTGDIFQVLLNGRAFPIKRQDDIDGAIREIVDGLNARRAARQKRLAASKVAMPDGVKASRRVREVHLRAQLANITELVEIAKEELTELTTGAA